jgi:ParB/RepB/Spo0J family partition protein
MDSNATLVDISLIQPNPEQPRQIFNQAALSGLADSIKAVGVIQPIVIEANPNGDGYIIHDGERRWRATKLAGLTHIPAVISQNGYTDQDRLVRAVVANEQRENLNPVEVARSYQKMADMGMNDGQIAAAVGKSRSVVANARRLLKLPGQHLKALESGDLSERQALALLPLFTMPEPIRNRLSTYSQIRLYIDSPNDLQNISSENIRRDLEHFHEDISRPFKGEFPNDQAVTGTKECKIVRDVCADCPYNYGRKCYYTSCYTQKIYFWKRMQLVPVETALQTGRWEFMAHYGTFVCLACGREYIGGSGTSNPEGDPAWYDAGSIYPTTEANRDKPSGFTRHLCINCHPAPAKPAPKQIAAQQEEDDHVKRTWEAVARDKSQNQQAIETMAIHLAQAPLPILKLLAWLLKDYDLLRAENFLVENDTATLAGKIATSYVNKYLNPKERDKFLTTLGFVFTQTEIIP